MLPPVPGPAMYLFAGIIMAQECPWGFWPGAMASIALCFVMKMSACVVQQVLIGGCSGNNLMVRAAVGVHKPFIRAIEQVLRRPGLSFGKVAILCGGPDWPTSVLAGVLKVPVLQCLVGTLPVTLTLAPGSLTGSFKLRTSDPDSGPLYSALTTMMLVATICMSVVFWVGMSWAVQGEFDYNRGLLECMPEKDVDLLWL